MNIIALDVDLHKIYAVSNDGTVLAKAEPSRELVMGAISEHIGGAMDKTVLIEVSSPVMYIKDPGVIHNVLKWALWNITTAEAISTKLTNLGYQVLVAPSHVWTKGHDLKTRHAVANCKQPQKDLRECEAMIYYYQKDPKSWLPLPQYLENL